MFSHASIMTLQREISLADIIYSVFEKLVEIQWNMPEACKIQGPCMEKFSQTFQQFLKSPKHIHTRLKNFQAVYIISKRNKEARKHELRAILNL